MANAIVSNKSGVFVKGEKMQPYFGTDLLITDPFWYAEEVEDGLGGEPGRATIIIPCAAGVRFKNAFSVAYNPDGPSALIKHGDRCAISRRYTDIETGAYLDRKFWYGHVHDIFPRPADDCLVLTAYDPREAIKTVRMVGSYVYNPTHNRVYYRQGFSTHVNPGGRPNFIYTPNGTPCLAEHPDFGLGSDGQPPDTALRSSAQASYGTLAALLMHLKAFWGYETSDDPLVVQARADALAQFPLLERMPSFVTWPDGFGSEVDEISQANFNDAVGQNYTILGGARKGRDMIFRGTSFVGSDGEKGVFDMIFEAAGGWSWTFDTLSYSSSGAQFELKAVPTRWLGFGRSIDLSMAMGGAPKDFKGPVIEESDYKESSRTTVTRAIGAGSHVKIEVLCSSRAIDHGGVTSALMAAWTAADFDAMRALAVTYGGGTPTPDSITKAWAKYWWVLTTWVLNPEFNFMAGTEFANSLRAPMTRPIMPTLLSFAGSSIASNDILPYPVRAEVNDGSSWFPGPEKDGLEVWDNGVIFMPGLRDIVLESANNAKGSFRWNTAEFAVSGGMLDITANDIRATLTIPCDHRLIYALRTASDLSMDAPSVGLMDDSPHVEKLSKDFSRSTYFDLNGLYEAWLRINSYPVPLSTGGVAATDLTDSRSPQSALRSDLPLLQNHTRRGLIDRFGLTCEGGWTYKGTILTTITPGVQIGLIQPVGNTNVKPTIVRRSIHRRIFTSRPSTDRAGQPIFENRTKLLPG